MSKKVSIFAGTHCVKEKESYYFDLAYRTGKLLAERGFTVATGAGPGLMDQALKGAREAGGETIGVGLRIAGRPQSKHITHSTVFDKLSPRQDRLIELGDVYIALPGGVGTLYEILNILALKRIKEVGADKPLILVDGYYGMLENIFQTMITEGFVDSAVHTLYQVVGTPEEAIEMIQ